MIHLETLKIELTIILHLKAILAALNKKADIISMSWTLPMSRDKSGSKNLCTFQKISLCLLGVVT
jgi:hypothetical protein